VLGRHFLKEGKFRLEEGRGGCGSGLRELLGFLPRIKIFGLCKVFVSSNERESLAKKAGVNLNSC
jgi:hypothetical protein